MNTEIILHNVNKYYGKKQALQNVNITIEKGMFGLLGRNGAGKTTLMKVIATLIPNNGGEITVCGIPIKNRSRIRSLVGYLPQEFSMYGEMTVYEAMDYLGVLSGLNKKTRKERIPVILRQVNLQKNHSTKVKAMSGGMKRRLGIAQAILHDPKVLIVDEPTAGLDPEERVRFRNLLCEIAEERIVILSTHIVGDVEATCEKIAILDEGVIIYNGTVKNLVNRAHGKIYTAEISKMELEELKSNYLVTGIIGKETTAIVRFIDNRKNIDNTENTENAENTEDTENTENTENIINTEVTIKGAIACEPNVEDAYMYLMHEKRGVL